MPEQPLNETSNTVTQSQPPASGFRRVFINRFSHKRAGWRFFAYAFLALGVGMGLTGALQLIPWIGNSSGFLTWPAVIERIVRTGAMLLAGYILLRWLDRRPFSLMGISFTTNWKRDFGLGLALGGALLTATLLILWAGGWMQLQLNGLSGGLVMGLFQAVIIFTLAGLGEELLVRGYPFQAFIEGSRPWIAVVVLSSLFAIMHLGNPNVTLPSALNIFLAGVLLSVCYLKTLSLWLPTGLHIAWNWTQSSFWGMAVSGYELEWTVFEATPTGPNWLSGGPFGAEASIVATIILGVATFLIWRSDKLAPSPELTELWIGYPQGYGLEPRTTSASE